MGVMIKVMRQMCEAMVGRFLVIILVESVGQLVRGRFFIVVSKKFTFIEQLPQCSN